MWKQSILRVLDSMWQIRFSIYQWLRPRVIFSTNRVTPKTGNSWNHVTGFTFFQTQKNWSKPISAFMTISPLRMPSPRSKMRIQPCSLGTWSKASTEPYISSTNKNAKLRMIWSQPIPISQESCPCGTFWRINTSYRQQKLSRWSSLPLKWTRKSVYRCQTNLYWPEQRLMGKLCFLRN